MLTEWLLAGAADIKRQYHAAWQAGRQAGSQPASQPARGSQQLAAAHFVFVPAHLLLAPLHLQENLKRCKGENTTAPCEIIVS